RKENQELFVQLEPDNGPRSSLSIGPGSDDVVGFTGSSPRDSPKGLGSSIGTCWEKTRRLAASMPEITRLAKVRS
ncbi:hypothetical protein B296_00038566, partial [Ensete ventricosum]